MELPQNPLQATVEDGEDKGMKEESGTSKTGLPEVETKKRRSRLKPSVPLPSGRLNVDKETAMLRAYVSQSKSGERAVHFSDIAGLVQTHETSISASKEFWEEIGLLERESRGEHKPARDLVAWALKVDFNPTEANANLHRAYDQAWFGETIRSAFQVHRSLKKDPLTNILANTAGGEKAETEPRARLLVDLLVSTGYLNESDSGELSLAISAPLQSAGPAVTELLASRAAMIAAPDALSAKRIAPTIPTFVTTSESNLGVSMEISVSNWSVEDVIRLLKFLRTGDDERTQDSDTPDPKP